ncbi:hypothetical protein BMS3Bbin11_01701 [bacterium BMS3Bbin11]|nr:hypothetical protein BMS3Bbin11_01701 [bacterium BMS3Bbin11]
MSLKIDTFRHTMGTNKFCSPGCFTGSLQCEGVFHIFSTAYHGLHLHFHFLCLKYIARWVLDTNIAFSGKAIRRLVIAKLISTDHHAVFFQFCIAGKQNCFTNYLCLIRLNSDGSLF